jgi:hypothetical protein
MNESILKQALVRTLKKNLVAVIFRHEDIRTSGIPDISVTANKHTIWLEVKYTKTNSVLSTGIQDERCRQLAKTGHCWHIVYSEQHGQKKTYIVHPKDIDDPLMKTPAERTFFGFAHESVVMFIRGIVSWPSL